MARNHPLPGDGDGASCRGVVVETFGRRRFKLALLSIRMARFADVNIGITPRNVRSDGLAPCRYSRLPKT